MIMNDKQLFILCSLMIAFISLSACQQAVELSQENHNEQVMPHSIEQNKTTIITKDKSAYSVLITPSLSSLPLNQYFDMTVDVRSEFQKALPYSVDLMIDAGMRAHNHGMNVKPIIERMSDNKFKVKGMLFHMPGEWFIKSIVKRGVMQDILETTVDIPL